MDGFQGVDMSYPVLPRAQPWTLQISVKARRRACRLLTAALMVTAAGLGGGCGIALAAAATPPTPAPASVAPAADGAEAFARIPFVEQAELSPDGTFLAGLFGISGQRHICIMSLFDKAKLRCIEIPDGTEPRSLRWVNDHNIIVGLHTVTSLGLGLT